MGLTGFMAYVTIGVSLACIMLICMIESKSLWDALCNFMCTCRHLEAVRIAIGLIGVCAVSAGVWMHTKANGKKRCHASDLFAVCAFAASAAFAECMLASGCYYCGQYFDFSVCMIAAWLFFFLCSLYVSIRAKNLRWGVWSSLYYFALFMLVYIIILSPPVHM